MRKFASSELEEFLVQVDRKLRTPCTIVLVGGGAISLAYHGTHATSDLDLWGQTEASFMKAVEDVNARRASRAAVQPTPILEAPDGFDARLQPLRMKGLRRLRIFVPEAHDLAMMKAARCLAHDLDGIEDIHRAHPLSVDTFVARYHEMTAPVMGPAGRFRTSFLAVLARLFGEAVADRVSSRLD